MPQATYAGKTIDLDDDGYMTDPSQWTREVAEALAAEEGITLTDAHWKVLEFCRADAGETGAAPGLRRISKRCEGVSMKDLYKLFPKGPGKLAARLAGLKKPVGCV